MNKALIKKINIDDCDLSQFRASFTGCIILSLDNKLILQKRGDDWPSHPGKISTFGGWVESSERPIDAMMRELAEEIEADTEPDALIPLGVVTEAITGYSELIYLYFWHDALGTIGECHEGDIIEFESVEAALLQPQLMDDVKYALAIAEEMKLI